MCASERTLRRLLAGPPEARPDGVEALNPTAAGRPWHRRVVAFVEETGIAGVAGSDAHTLSAIGQAYTTFPGRAAEELRGAILARETRWSGAFHPSGTMFGTFFRQLRKYGADVRDELAGLARAERTGRDLGYPGGRRRPAIFDESELSR